MRQRVETERIRQAHAEEERLRESERIRKAKEEEEKKLRQIELEQERLRLARQNEEERLRQIQEEEDRVRRAKAAEERKLEILGQEEQEAKKQLRQIEQEKQKLRRAEELAEREKQSEEEKRRKAGPNDDKWRKSLEDGVSKTQRKVNELKEDMEKKLPGSRSAKKIEQPKRFEPVSSSKGPTYSASKKDVSDTRRSTTSTSGQSKSRGRQSGLPDITDPRVLWAGHLILKRLRFFVFKQRLERDQRGHVPRAAVVALFDQYCSFLQGLSRTHHSQKTFDAFMLAHRRFGK